MRKWRLFVAALLAGLILNSCGGGGETADTPAPAPSGNATWDQAVWGQATWR